MQILMAVPNEIIIIIIIDLLIMLDVLLLKDFKQEFSTFWSCDLSDFIVRLHESFSQVAFTSHSSLMRNQKQRRVRSKVVLKSRPFLFHITHTQTQKSAVKMACTQRHSLCDVTKGANAFDRHVLALPLCDCGSDALWET